MQFRSRSAVVRNQKTKMGIEEEDNLINHIDSSHRRTVSTLQKNLLERLRSEGSDHDADHLAHICHQVWQKFCTSHQKSPSHKNNNVQNCSTARRSRRDDKVGNVHSSCHERCQCKEEADVVPEIMSCYQKLLRQIEHWTVFAHSILSFLVIFLKFLFHSTIISILIYCMIVLHKPTQVIISRNTQDFIYPFMRSLRMFALPYVEHFPAITNFYEEPCIIPNPYYTMGNIDCWPCETVRNIVDLTGFTNFSAVYHDNGIPFIVKEAFESGIGIDDIRSICLQYIDLMTKVYVHPNLNDISTLQKLFQPQSSVLEEEGKLHVGWTISRVSTARLLRKYFPKPYFIPNGTEVSVQHFLFIDQHRSASYSLPVTEFANVFMMQASGTRYIVLIPTDWCQARCKVVSTILQPRDVLFYNWLYWRPMSVAVESSSTNLSVTYVGSFY